MSKNTKLSQLDPNQVAIREHDGENDAKRVVLVGGEKLDISIDSDKITQAIKEGMASLKFETLVPEKIDQVEPHFNIITVEKQVFIPQIEYKIIEIPVIVKEIEYKIIEVPVSSGNSNESVLKEVPMLFKVLLGGHALTWLGLLISHFIK